ncbi:putative peptidase S28, alpha/Beta hydrolase [Helianthus debilis subsp. tardiflorus]
MVFIGISYPGALSAWFRLKFPHLTCGSLTTTLNLISRLVSLQNLNVKMYYRKLLSLLKKSLHQMLKY